MAKPDPLVKNYGTRAQPFVTQPLTAAEWQVLGRALELLFAHRATELKAQGFFTDALTGEQFTPAACMLLRRKVGYQLGALLHQQHMPVVSQAEGELCRGAPTTVTVGKRKLETGKHYWIRDEFHQWNGCEVTLLTAPIGSSVGEVEVLRTGERVKATLATLMEVQH